MKASKQNSTNAGSPALTLKINIIKSPLGKTSGSVTWLLKQEIVARFDEISVSEVVFRAAKLQIGICSCVVAAENYCYKDEGLSTWKPSTGIHSIPIQWDCGENAELPFGVSMTPPARHLVEDAATIIRRDFAAWVGGDTIGKGGDVEKVERVARISHVTTAAVERIPPLPGS